MSAKGVAATKPHAKETTKASAGVQICTRDAMRFASRVQMYSLAANAARIAAPLYFVDAARPPANPAPTNDAIPIA